MAFSETSEGKHDSACGRNLPLEATASANSREGQLLASMECVHGWDRPPFCTPGAQRVRDFTAGPVGFGKDPGAPC